MDRKATKCFNHINEIEFIEIGPKFFPRNFKPMKIRMQFVPGIIISEYSRSEYGRMKETYELSI